MDGVCRTCLIKSNKLISIYTDPQLIDKIETISSVQIIAKDSLPKTICTNCNEKIELCYNFRRQIIDSDSALQTQSFHAKPNEVEERISEPVTSFNNNSNNATPILLESTEDNLLFVSKVKSEYVKEDVYIIEEECYLDKEGKTEESRNLFQSPVEKCFVNTANTDSASIEVETNSSLISSAVENKIDQLLDKEIVHKCNECNLECLNYNQLQKHKSIHIKSSKSVCNMCGKTLLACNLKKHMQIHIGTPVECKECGKLCKNADSLRGHLFIHNRIKFQCNVCGKVYNNRSGYTEHRRRHLNGDIKTIECHLCTKKFFEKKSLKKHIRSHTGERPYTCEYCKKGFSSSHALKTHVRRHTNEKPYTCEFCQAAFPQRVSLRTHVKSKHSVKENSK